MERLTRRIVSVTTLAWRWMCHQKRYHALSVPVSSLGLIAVAIVLTLRLGYGQAAPMGRSFTGDSTIDLMYFNAAEHAVYVTRSQGSSFEYAGQWIAPDQFGYDGARYYPGDFNGDGKIDLGYFEFNDDTFHVALSSGDGFPRSSVWVQPHMFGNPNGQFYVGDYN